MNTSATEGGVSKQPKTTKSEESSTAKKPEEIVADANLSTPTATLSNSNVETMEVDIDANVSEVTPIPQMEEEIVQQQEAPIKPVIKKIIDREVGSRRGSQESAITTTTNTTTTHSTSTSSDSSSDSSDSDSSSSEEDANQENVFIDQEQINNIVKMCIKNLEECISRFPEHYKSIYRLVHHFLNINESLDKCRQLLLTSDYKTTLGNSVSGLFHERKNNNFFNGIWRIPSQEIDRPGNFTTHLSKCIIILMDVLKKTNDYETLIDLALQLQRNPEADKKYLNDTDKKELFQQAVACGVQAFKNKLRETLNGISEGKNNDRDLLSLMLEIFKANRKTLKNFQQKDQSLFSGVLVDVYKEYIKDKMILPETANFTDLAFKMCQQEINYRKNLEKGIIGPNPNPVTPPIQLQQLQQPTATSSPILVKSVSEINKSILNSSGSGSNQIVTSPTTPKSNKIQAVTTSNPTTPTTSNPSSSSARTKPRSSSLNKTTAQLNSMYNSMIMAMYSNPSLFTPSYINEYYKMLGISSTSSSQFTPQQLAMLADPNFLASIAASPTSSKATNEASFLEGLMATYSNAQSANHLQGLQQNLLSNSLSITTTTITSTTTSTSSSSKMSLSAATTSTSKAQTSASRKSTSDIKEPVKKSASTGSNIGKNDSGNKFNLLGTSLKLPDLPKSLSITPTMTVAKSTAQKSQSEKRKEKVSSLGSLSKFNLNPSLSITPERIPQGNRNMLTSYEDFLKSYQNSVQGVTSSAKKSSSTSNVSSHSSGINPSLLKQQKQKSVIQPSASSNKQQQQKSQVSNAKIPYDFGKNIASSFGGLPISSPTLSHSPFSQQTPPLTPSPSRASAVTSPPKTLQQKLAERKQQNQQQKSSTAKKPGK